MVNVNLMKGKIVEKGLSVEDVAHYIGINKATFYRKLSGNGSNFLIGEATKIVEYLGLSSEDATAIFFAHLVA